MATGLAGLGTGLIALGFATLIRARRRTREEPATRLPPVMAKIGVTAASTIAVVLLLPSATLGQTWQVVEYYDSDALGSIRAVTNDQGQVVARHDFLPFGDELSPQTPPHDTKLFTGQERDFETGQDYFNARQYRTDVGRFLTPDPVALGPQVVGSQGLNSYSYVWNNPLGLVDPTGLNPAGLNEPMLDSDWSPTSLNLSSDPWDYFDWTKSLVWPDLQLSMTSWTTIQGAAVKGGFSAEDMAQAILSAAYDNLLDPNVLVGLAFVESSIRPSKDNGDAKGLYQILPGRAKDLGISDDDIHKWAVQIPKVAAALSHALYDVFKGNLDLTIASWTMGVKGASDVFRNGGMEKVRNVLKEAKHPEYGTVGPMYIDKVKEFCLPAVSWLLGPFRMWAGGQ